MKQSVRYTIRFDGIEAADAGLAAESLRQSLQMIGAEIKVRRVRTDADTMDFGTALEIVLGAPAILELAKGIAAWLARSHSSKITIIGPNGTTIVENLRARDASGLAERLQTAHGEP